MEQTEFTKKFDARNFEFLSEQSSKYKCVKCFKVASKPIKEKLCGAIFCADCVPEWEESKACWQCKSHYAVYEEDQESKLLG